MSIFSKINSLFLAITVIISSFGQIQDPSFQDGFSHQPEADTTPGYLDVSTLSIWGILYLDSDELNPLTEYSYLDSEEKQKNNPKASIQEEASLKRFPSLYLLFSKKIDRSLSVRELLYPFHFYF